jgi:hypothetical protein
MTAYITRLMKCPECGKSAHHMIQKDLAREPVTCWECDGAGKRVACVEVPVIRQAFAKEVYAVRLESRTLQHVMEIRMNASNQMDRLNAAKRALADVVVEAGGSYTRADLVTAVLAGIAHLEDDTLEFITSIKGNVDDANAIVDRLLGGGI